MSSLRAAAATALVVSAGLWGIAAHAQGVYRIVGPDGRVTFSDRPPADAKASPAQSVSMPGGAAGTSTASLPGEVRKAATEFPVTLYTTRECTPCAAARAFLQQRGVPFSERTVNTNEDIAALSRLSGSSNLPFLTIGGQHINGYSDAEWSQYLDAAGYPKISQLPASYRNAEPTPLVAVQRPAPRPVQAAQPPQRADATPPANDAPPPSNPAGIRF
jgi:glutaredoxin